MGSGKRSGCSRKQGRMKWGGEKYVALPWGEHSPVGEDKSGERGGGQGAALSLSSVGGAFSPIAHWSVVPFWFGDSEPLFHSALGSLGSHYPCRSFQVRGTGRTACFLWWRRDPSCPLHLPQPNPTSSLEVPVVVLPERLQDDGDDRHEGFHDAELQCSLHRGETRCTPGSRDMPPLPLPAPPQEPAPLFPAHRHSRERSSSQERPALWGEIGTSSRAAESGEQGSQKAAPERQNSPCEWGEVCGLGTDRFQDSAHSAALEN